MTIARAESLPDTASEATHQRRTWAVPVGLTAYVVIACGLFWPALPWNNSRLPAILGGGYGFGDPAQMTWFLEWIPFALHHGFNIFHSNYIDYPHGVNLADNTLSPLLGLLALPITTTLGPVAAFNVLLRFAFASSAGSMFLVLRTWSRWPAAFIGGLFYGFGPYVVSQGQSHLDLAFIPIPPLIVWCLNELLVTRRKRPGRTGVLLGALAAAQALIDPELLSLLGVVIAIGLLGLAVVSRHELVERFGHLARAAFPALLSFVAITGYMFWYMLFATGHLIGPVLKTSTLQGYHADLFGPIIPTFYQLFLFTSYFETAYRFVGYNLSENSTYLSLPLILLVGFFAIRWRRDRRLVAAALLALVAFVLSLGPALTINGRSAGVWLPESVFSHLPLLDNTVPARFSMVVALFTSIAIGLGAQHAAQLMTSRVATGWRDTAARTSVTVLTIASIVLLVPRLPFVTKAPPWPSDTLSTLNVIPPGSVVLTYPFAVGDATEAMSWQATDSMRFRIIGGYATVQETPRHGDSYPALLALPYMQEYLTNAQSGQQEYYPKPDPRTDPRRALCRFIQHYRVGAVVFWNAGEQPEKVSGLFHDTLGPPARTSHDGTLAVWLTRADHCP
jgi:hypothetical protein